MGIPNTFGSRVVLGDWSRGGPYHPLNHRRDNLFRHELGSSLCNLGDRRSCNMVPGLAAEHDRLAAFRAACEWITARWSGKSSGWSWPRRTGRRCWSSFSTREPKTTRLFVTLDDAVLLSHRYDLHHAFLCCRYDPLAHR